MRRDRKEKEGRKRRKEWRSPEELKRRENVRCAKGRERKRRRGRYWQDTHGKG